MTQQQKELHKQIENGDYNILLEIIRDSVEEAAFLRGFGSGIVFCSFLWMVGILFGSFN